MELGLKRIGQRIVVSFPDRVNLEGAASTAFKNRLKGVVADGARHVVMDLGNVGFIDSCGLGALISALKILRGSGGSLVLANLSEPVEAVLRITRLVRVFDTTHTVADAAKLASQPGPVVVAESVA